MSTSASTDNEFALLPDPQAVQRRWVTVSSGEHISGVVWGAGPPEAVLLHAAGGDARDWDGVLSAYSRPALALDLPGHGRSSHRANPVYAPRRLVLPVSEALRSFAPKAKVVAGTGLGALTAAAVALRHPALVRALVLVGTLPDATEDGLYLWEGLAKSDLPVTVVRRDLTDAAVADLQDRLPSAQLVTDTELAHLLIDRSTA